MLEIAIECSGCRRRLRLSVSGRDSQSVICPSCGKALFVVRPISGYVYALSNSAMPDLVKIGCTTRSVEERTIELNSATGVPSPFTIERYCESMDPPDDETSIHRRLSAHRVKSKEFFRISAREALRVVSEVTGSQVAGGVQSTDAHWGFGAYRRDPDSDIDEFPPYHLRSRSGRK